MAKTNNLVLGEVLVQSEIITRQQLEEALEYKNTKNILIGEALIELGFCTEKQVYKALEYMYHIPYMEISEMSVPREVFSLISEQLARKYIVLPVEKEQKSVTVAMADPLNYYAIDDIKRVTGLDVKPAISAKSDILNAIEMYYGNESAEKAVEDLKNEYSLVNFEELAQISENEVSNAPVVRLINSIIQHAIKVGASDVHIEPMEEDMRVRFRVDGDLQEVMRSSKTAHPAVITRIKIIGNMDIAEKRIPQDGRVEMTVDNRDVDLRLSILPTVYGEKVVIRILGFGSGVYTKEQLGFTQENLELFDRIIKSPNGIILVCGPTGSGKSTTLYTVLSELNRPRSNIITVEDPVEYKLAGVNQVQVNIKAGLTFATGLRSILRQDPDIIMVGEIRDSETAQIAIRASITGHLVLSTIHTNDAASAVSRLVDMGIEPYLLASSLSGVVAQRLIKRICPKCKTPYKPDHAEMMALRLSEPKTLYKGAGCPACNFTGYQKRIAIHEVLQVRREIKELIERRATTEQIRQMAARFGTTSLHDNCVKLVLEGITTTEEMLKVTYSID